MLSRAAQVPTESLMSANKKRNQSSDPHSTDRQHISNMDKSINPETLSTLARATALSLDGVRSRVAKENPDWTTTRVDAAVAEYRKWLVLIALNKFGKLGMCSTDVDEVWHAHILFTRKYAADCEALCGSFIHHQPNSEEEKRDETSAKNTLSALQQIFGDVHPVWLSSANAGRLEPHCCHIDCEPVANCQHHPPNA
jgi:hypothetical protein